MGKKTRSSFELFPTDAPVGAAELIGRERDVARVAASLAGGGNVIIAGPRRTGKTSVALAAVDRCEQDGLYTCHVDLFRLADAQQLAEALVAGLLTNRPALRRAIHHAREGGRRLAEALSGVAVRRALGELDLDLRVLAGGEDRAAVRHALELAQRIAQADGVRVVLFFDEFQEVAAPRGPYGDPDVVTKQMRAVLQDSSQVSTLFAGSMQHLMRDLFAPAERAFSQFGAFHELDPITPGDWRDGLAARFAESGVRAADRPLAQIVAAGEGHPRATMLLAQQTHLVAVEERADALDEILVAEGVERAMRAERLKHEQTLEQIRRLGRHALRLAERVARGEPLYEGLSPKVARDTLNALRDAGIVDTAGPRQGWSVVDPLVRRFLAGLPG